MNKQDFIREVASRSNLKLKQMSQVLENVTEVIMEAVSEGEDVAFVNFGTFSTKKRSARRGRNPQTGEIIDIPSSIVPSFCAGKKFKDMVN